MTYDPDLIDRLVRLKATPRVKCTADECDGGFIHRHGPISGDWDEPCDACFSTGLAAVQNLAAMADQLEAARREVERLTVESERHENVGKALAASHSTLRAECELMRPVVEAAEQWRDAIDDRSGPADGDDIMDAAINMSDAIDAYRAAKGKT